ncbi:MAG: hypothetical protein ABSG87_02455 [Verrucomicrobiota bacterium]
MSFTDSIEAEFENDIRKSIFQELGIDILRVPPDDGKVFCGKIVPRKSETSPRHQTKKQNHAQNDKLNPKAKASRNGTAIGGRSRERKNLPAIQH